MIPQGWQSIGEPDVPELSPDAKAVRNYIAENQIAQITHKTESVMCRALHMGLDRLQDAVYEFRKWEAIMAKRMTEEEKSKIIALHEAGETNRAIASKVYCSPQTVSNVLQAEKLKQDLETDKKPVATVNPEFEQAVKDMIAERDAADAEKQSANADPDIPDYVLYAVDCRISELEQRLQDFDNQKAMLEHQLRVLQSDIREVQTEHDKLADWKQEVDP